MALSYYKVYHSKASEIDEISNAIHKCIDNLSYELENQTIMDSSLGSGLAGVAYALKMTSELTGDIFLPSNYVRPLENVILASLTSHIDRSDYDLLHGGAGLATYILHYTKHEKLLYKFLSFLDDTAIKYENEGLFWYSYRFNSTINALKIDNDRCNFGLAHGIASIISILAELYKKNIGRKICLRLLKGAVNFLMHTRDKAGFEIFPSFLHLTGEREPARFGWCYGDLGISIALLKAGKYCGMADWIVMAKEIGAIACTRNVNNASLDEHSFCHGYLGTMHLFNRMYLATGETRYLRAMNYWKGISSKQRDYRVNKTGLFQVDFDEDHTRIKVCHSGLLQGLAGHLLCLLSQSHSIQYPWDRIFLTNIEY